MADTENTAAPKKEGRPVITRRALCVGLGGTAALLGLGAVRYAGSARSCAARRPGRGGARLGVHSLREVLRGVSARRHRAGSSGGRHPEHAHARHELRRELVRLVHRGERRRASVRGIVPHRGAQGRLDPRDWRARRGGTHQDLCLAYRLIGCRFCYDACQFEAMELDENNRPYVIADACNGCRGLRERLRVAAERLHLRRRHRAQPSSSVPSSRKGGALVNTKRLRTIIPLAVIGVIGVGFATHVGVGTLSAIGWQDISLLCPLGAGSRR